MEDEKERYKRAKARVKEIKEFYTHLIVYAIVISILAIINLVTMYTSNYRFYWFLFPLAGWGFGLFWHAMGVFVFSKTKSSNWEKRKIKEIMDKMDED